MPTLNYDRCEESPWHHFWLSANCKCLPHIRTTNDAIMCICEWSNLFALVYLLFIFQNSSSLLYLTVTNVKFSTTVVAWLLQTVTTISTITQTNIKIHSEIIRIGNGEWCYLDITTKKMAFNRQTKPKNKHLSIRCICIRDGDEIH